jgi:hypothetical protein
MYANNGAASFSQVIVFQAISDATLDLAIADLNGDGRHDVVTGQGESGNFTNRVYLNNGTADALAPAFKLVETPAAIGASETVFRARVQDAVSDDGHVNATLTYTWITTGTGAGSGGGTARPQGGGQWRAAVPTNPGTLSVSLTWTATDDVGNAANSGPVVVNAGGSGWTDLGDGLAGVSGIPSLAGTGTLVTGQPFTLNLGSAAASASAALFVSLADTPTGFKGGTLHTVPVVLSLSLSTNGSGQINLGGNWPAGASGLSFYVQYAIGDGAAPFGVSLSNYLRGDVP